MNFSRQISDQEIILTPGPVKSGLLKSLLARGKTRTLSSIEHAQQNVLFAIADLREIGDRMPGAVDITEEQIVLSHDAAASLSDRPALALGLPAGTDRTLKTDVAGLIGGPGFRLIYEWSRNGIREFPRRTGAILHTSDGDQRIPIWMKRALDLADGQVPSSNLPDQWATLAGFRQALEPENVVPNANRSSQIAMTDFLSGLEVRLANRFSLAVNDDLDDFEVVPFSTETIDRSGISDGEVAEEHAELSDNALAAFQFELRAKGSKAAYRVADRSYLVIDPATSPILDEMNKVQSEPRENRKEFIRNPRARITQAVSNHLESRGDLDELTDAQREELIEKLAGPGLVETREFSDRVTGIVIYKASNSAASDGGTTWLPEVFSERVASAIDEMDHANLELVRAEMQNAIKTGEDTILVAGEEVPVHERTMSAIDAEIEARRLSEEMAPDGDIADEEDGDTGPVILDTSDNEDEMEWFASLTPRKTKAEITLPTAVTTPLKPHQLDAFDWSTKAWKRGLPGILNADEQGLGKTLQTISFLTWLKQETAGSAAPSRGPILIVAPTSLLVNWEEEVEKHVSKGGFGHLVRLYGSHLSAQMGTGKRGKETDTGTPRLDLAWLDEAFSEGRAHRYWFLTTYTTLTNYQHSLASIPFAALVFDEIQALKNPSSLRSRAALAMRADFRIGLTGTPIENATVDLWAVMEQLSAGALGTRKDFLEAYSEPDENNMQKLYESVFTAGDENVPLALRRLKENVAKDLPRKARVLHPRLMPDVQASVYDEARVAKSTKSKGAALKMLHHIRSVSVHPYLDAESDDNSFIEDSARLTSVMKTLREIQSRNERALVFIEHVKMQYRFAELVKREFKLENVDIINGSTAIPKRQQIVNRFQRHLMDDRGFDLLVLGPKAAGTGLTLTAATHVIHLSRWWNPAVEEQCNDRVHRIGQTKPVTVHLPMAVHPGFGSGSFDCLLHSLMQRKRKMASSALWPMGDTQADADGLQQQVIDSGRAHEGATLHQALAQMFERDGYRFPDWEIDTPLLLPD